MIRIHPAVPKPAACLRIVRRARALTAAVHPPST